MPGSRASQVVFCLQFWIYEHTSLIDANEDYATIPRYLKWDLTLLSNRLASCDLDRLDETTVSEIVGLCLYTSIHWTTYVGFLKFPMCRIFCLRFRQQLQRLGR